MIGKVILISATLVQYKPFPEPYGPRPYSPPPPYGPGQMMPVPQPPPPRYVPPGFGPGPGTYMPVPMPPRPDLYREFCNYGGRCGRF